MTRRTLARERAAHDDLVAVAAVIEPRLRSRGPQCSLQPFAGDFATWNRRIAQSPDREYALHLDDQVHAAVRVGERRDLARWLITSTLTLVLAQLAWIIDRDSARVAVTGAALAAVAVGIARATHWDRLEHVHAAVCPLLDGRPS